MSILLTAPFFYGELGLTGGFGMSEKTARNWKTYEDPLEANRPWMEEFLKPQRRSQTERWLTGSRK